LWVSRFVYSHFLFNLIMYICLGKKAQVWAWFNTEKKNTNWCRLLFWYILARPFSIAVFENISGHVAQKIAKQKAHSRQLYLWKIEYETHTGDKKIPLVENSHIGQRWNVKCDYSGSCISSSDLRRSYSSEISATTRIKQLT